MSAGLFAPTLALAELAPWRDKLGAALALAWQPEQDGNLPRWLQALANLPSLTPSCVELDAATVRVGAAQDCSDEQRARLQASLRALHPWRKGPFEFFGIHIDTEWRSDWKWTRIAPHIRPLNGRRVLDVGCGSGYHCWRMAGAGAQLVLGVDPTPLYAVQFMAAQHYLRHHEVHMLPLRGEDLPADMALFDTVFSMGVLYHRKSPLDHLAELRGLLRQGGELVLETLVIEGNVNTLLMPRNRYAKMRNVWFIPSCAMLETWLMRSGFSQPRVVDVTVTTTNEQRRTDWMRFESLADFLDPTDASRTLEGLPAPRRATIIATRT